MTRAKSHFQGAEPILEKFLQFLRFHQVLPFIKIGDRVLDLGCGYKGALLKNISSKINEGVGVDVSVTKKKIAKNIRLISEKNGEVNIPKDHFDLATCLAVIEHLENPLNLLKIAYKSLKKNGRILITTPTPAAKPVLEFLSFKLGLVSRQEIKDHKKYYTEEELRDLLEKVGVKTTKVHVRFFLLGLNTFVVAKK
jgi:2-polyprenyl-3-methyl-5-hydroxy-6-metoxy-1,4-benzoquinol methylase